MAEMTEKNAAAKAAEQTDQFVIDRHVKQRAGDIGNLNLASTHGGQALPIPGVSRLMRSGAVMEYVRMPPPAFKIAEKVMNAKEPRNVKKAIRDAWYERHRGLRADDLKPLPKKQTLVKPCFLAGECLHNPRGTAALEFVRLLQSTMRRALPPKAVVRVEHDHARLLIRVFHMKPGSLLETAIDDADFWFHCGFANLNLGQPPMFSKCECVKVTWGCNNVTRALEIQT
jgi:hypothetical protein